MRTKGFSIIETVLVIVVLLLAVGGIYMYLTNDNSIQHIAPTPTPTVKHQHPTESAEPQTVGWQHFHDLSLAVNYGFDFDYPANWQLDEADKNGGCMLYFKPSNSTDNDRLCVQVYGDDHGNALAMTSKAKAGQQVTMDHQMIVANQTTSMYVIDQGVGQSPRYVAGTYIDGVPYRVTITNQMQQGVGYFQLTSDQDIDGELDVMFHDILSTFTITQ